MKWVRSYGTAEILLPFELRWVMSSLGSGDAVAMSNTARALRYAHNARADLLV